MSGATHPIVTRLVDWCRTEALPFWAEAGVDDRFGGFVEALDFAGRDANLDYKRTRVTCRQVYSFAHATVLGWFDGRSLISRGCAFLEDRAWLGEDSGFARLLDQAGNVTDPTPDLYEQAFALLAFSWAYRATADTAYRDWTMRTFAVIENRFADESGAAYHHALPPDGRRLQNPHMHLLEAAIAAHSTFDDPRFADCARRLLSLFQSRLFDRVNGRVGEEFADDWSPIDDETGERTEPGHLFEWIWLLDASRAMVPVTGGESLVADHVDAASALFAFAERYGVDPETSAVFNAIAATGRVTDAASRTWPNTERLKAAVALQALNGTDPTPVIESSGRLLLERYLRPAPGFPIPRGAWIDVFDRSGRPTAANVPASTFYHLLLAVAELGRISG